MVDETDIPNYNNLLSKREIIVAFLKGTIRVAMALVKQCRPFDDENFFLKLTTDVLSCFGEKCWEVVKLYQNIPLSRFTITRRTEFGNIHTMQPKTD